MNLIKRLFGGTKQTEGEAMRGAGPVQTSDQQSATRARMEAEMVADRERRQAQVAPGQVTPPAGDEREQAVIAMVSQACGDRNLQTSTVEVQKLEGGSVSTLRFTLDDVASTDLERERITSATESVEELATAIVAELRRQLGETSV
jgi:hypothetical protein